MDNQDEKGGRGYCVVDIFFVTEELRITFWISRQIKK